MNFVRLQYGFTWKLRVPKASCNFLGLPRTYQDSLGLPGTSQEARIPTRILTRILGHDSSRDCRECRAFRVSIVFSLSQAKPEPSPKPAWARSTPSQACASLSQAAQASRGPVRTRAEPTWGQATPSWPPGSQEVRGPRKQYFPRILA